MHFARFPLALLVITLLGDGILHALQSTMKLMPLAQRRCAIYAASFRRVSLQVTRIASRTLGILKPLPCQPLLAARGDTMPQARPTFKRAWLPFPTCTARTYHSRPRGWGVRFAPAGSGWYGGEYSTQPLKTVVLVRGTVSYTAYYHIGGFGIFGPKFYSLAIVHT